MSSGRASLRSLRGRTTRASVSDAVADLRSQIDQPGLSGVFFFATPGMDFAALAAGMDAAFDCPTMGCTTAGEITSEHGHERGAVVAASLASPGLRVLTTLLGPGDLSEAAALRARTEALLSDRTAGARWQDCFGMVIADGLSMGEERLAAGVSATLGRIPLVGGSAGDELAFKSTQIGCNGVTQSCGAVLTLVETEHPFHIFHSHHFVPTERRMVITRADPSTRRVYEIDGLPAAIGYAGAIGIDPDQLSPAVYSSNPVMLRVGGQNYIRSIQQANDDGSLTFYCAIDNGLVLRVAEPQDIVSGLRDAVRDIYQRMPGLELTIGFDCVLRGLEIRERGLIRQMAEELRDAKLIGFNTYGEQFGGLHVNQTITGVALGNAA